jgi:hypothetical protein
MPLRPTYEALAAALTPVEREILETLGEIIAFDLLRQQDRKGALANACETDPINLTTGRAC